MAIGVSGSTGDTSGRGVIAGGTFGGITGGTSGATRGSGLGKIATGRGVVMGLAPGNNRELVVENTRIARRAIAPDKPQSGNLSLTVAGNKLRTFPRT